MKSPWLVLALLVVLSGGCSRGEEMEAEAPSMAAIPKVETVAARSAGSGDAAPPPAVRSRKLIRRLDVHLVVRDTEAAAQRLQQLAASLGGFVSDLNAGRSEGVLHYQMTLRVPAERLDRAREEIRGIALRVEREQMSTEDVTDQYVDLDARMRSLQTTESELQELLAESRERSRKVGEVMEIHRELTGVRTQVEQIQGQLNALQNLVGLSTIQVSLEPDAAGKPIAAGGWHPNETVRSSFSVLVGFLQGLADLVIFLVVVALPVALVILIPVLLLRKAWKRWGTKREPKQEETA
ncbi:MAG TPA: DUF4349 domain-containing protein [Thermoanaerobaculia bacterium]|nr:DUF4349 domain-containing protein [Thermoanaerobaculia bacterium]